MARVDHKRIKRLMNEKRSRITDRQFFTSRGLAGHFEDIAAAQTGRHDLGRRVHVIIFWRPKSQETACTDNREIRINAGHPLVTKTRGRLERYWQVCGMFAHELAHVLYTDFLCIQSYQKALEDGRWFPAAPDLKTAAEKTSEREIWEFIKEDEVNRELFIQLAHHISNVLEDGYIEHRFLNEFPGRLGYGLEMHRKKKWEMMPTVTQMKEQEEEDGMPVFASILQSMLSYALFGEIKYGDEPLSDERIRAVFRLIDEIDEAVSSTSVKVRLMTVSTIMVRLWDYARDYLEEMKRNYNEAAASGGSMTAGEYASGILSGMSGATAIGSGRDAAGDAGDGDTSVLPAVTAASRAKTHADAEESSGPEEEENGEEDAESPGEKTEEGDSGQEEDGGEGSREEDTASDAMEDGEEEDAPLLTGRSCDNKKKGASPAEEGRIPLQETSTVSAPAGGTVTRNEDYAGEFNEHAASDIERILGREAEGQACEELENERLRELNELAQNISYGNIHEGVSVVVQRIGRADEAMKEQYMEVSAPLAAISKQMQKSIARQLKESRRGGKLTGLMYGRRLDTHALCRNDGKVFYKNTLPNEIPELAVGLLLDESGSMHSCDRCTYARATAIILYDFCRGLGIPVMVYGHSTGYDRDGKDSVELYSYAEFESIDQDDKENIERIYGDSFMDITDLEQLPVKLTGVVKRHIRL